MDLVYYFVVALAALLFATTALMVLSIRRTRELLTQVKRGEEALMRAHQRLKSAHEELKSVDKLKTDFMNIAAHELKTPLVPMVGYLHLINRKKLGPEDRESLDIALRNTKRLQRLVDDILDIAKLESKVMKFRVEDVQLADLVRDSVAGARPFAGEKGITLKAVAPRRLQLVHGDPGRLAQVLTNLINNAIKFTDRGNVVVEARARRGDVAVEVRDTGIGIAKEDIPKLFTKFFQAETSARRKYGGTGLGLAICKEIVQAHGGKIWADSEPGKGSTFSFSLPIKGKALITTE